MASRAFPFNFCIIKWLFSRDLHYLRSGITAVRRITPGTNSHLRVPYLRTPPWTEFPFPHSSREAGRERGEPSAGQQTRSSPPARGTMLSPPPAPPPRSKAAQPNGSTCTPHPELNGRHDARGAGGEGGKRKQEGGSGTRGRAGPSAPYVPRRPQAPTRGGSSTAPGPRIAPPPPTAPPPPVSPHATPSPAATRRRAALPKPGISPSVSSVWQGSILAAPFQTGPERRQKLDGGARALHRRRQKLSERQKEASTKADRDFPTSFSLFPRGWGAMKLPACPGPTRLPAPAQRRSAPINSRRPRCAARWRHAPPAPTPSPAGSQWQSHKLKPTNHVPPLAARGEKMEGRGREA